MKRHSVVVLVLCLGFTLSLAGFALVRVWEHSRIQDLFEKSATQAIDAISDGVEENLETLTELSNYFSENPNIGRESFQEFVSPYLEKNSGLYALQWVPRVRQSQRTAYEDQAELDGHTGFRITERKGGGQIVPAKERDEYFPVYYVEPFEENSAVFGYDVSSNPLTRKLLEASRDSGGQLATSTEPLVPQRRDLLGVFVISPVYLQGAPTDSEEQRRDNLRGFTIAALRVGDIVSNQLEEVNTDWMDVYLYDDSDPTGSNFLNAYAATSRSRRTGSFERRKWELVRGPHVAETIDVAGRKWSILAIPIPGYVREGRTWLPWGILLCGLIFTGVIALGVLVSPAPKRFKVKKQEEEGEVSETQPVQKESAGQESKDYERRVEELRTNLEKQQVEAERLSLQSQLSQTQSELQQLTEVVAQSVSLPLRSIHTHLLEAAKDPNKQKELYQRLGRVNATLDRVIEYSGVGQRDLSPIEDIDLHELMDTIAQDLDPKQKLTIDIENDMPKVHARRIHLQQIFEYLLGRALGAARADQGTVHIESDTEGAEWVCTVRDNGRPISPQYLETLFDMRTLGGADWAQDAYTAGLPVVKKVVEFYSGTIKVESSDSEGTVFKLTFPKNILTTVSRRNTSSALQHSVV